MWSITGALSRPRGWLREIWSILGACPEILKVDGLTPHFQIHIDRSANLAALTVRVEPNPASRLPAAALGTALADHIKANIGVSAEIAVMEPGQVPRSAGKAQRVAPCETAAT